MQHDSQNERNESAPRPDARRRAGVWLRAWAGAVLWATAAGALLELARVAGRVMADPTASAAGATASGVVGVALVAVFGASAPEYAAILMAACIGGAVQVTSITTRSRGHALAVLLSYAGGSACCTGLVVWLLQAKAGWDTPPQALSLAVAFGLAAWGRPIYTAVRQRIARAAGSPGERAL